MFPHPITNYSILGLLLAIAKITYGCQDPSNNEIHLSAKAKVRTLSKSLCNECLFTVEPRNQHSFAIIRADETKFNSSLHLTVKIEVAKMYSPSSQAECLANLQVGKRAKSAGLSSAKWLINGSILLETYDEYEDAQRNLKLVSVDPRTCAHASPYQLGLIPKYHEVSANEHGKFAVYRSNYTACHGFGCAYDFPLSNRTMIPSGIDAPRVGVYVEPVSTVDRDLYVIGYLNGAGYYGTFWLDLKNIIDERYPNTEQLIYIGDAKKSNAMADSLTFCWVQKSGKDKHVTCSRFHEDAELDFTRTVEYPVPISLVQVKHTSDEIVLVVREFKDPKSQDKVCGDVFVSVVTRHKEPTILAYREPSLFNCLTNRKKFVRSDSKRVGVEAFTSIFVCRSGEKLTSYQLSST